VLQRSNYDAEPMLKACGITIARNFTEVDGRVLQPPKVGHYYLSYIILDILRIVVIGLASQR
jgi:hypothetical protein